LLISYLKEGIMKLTKIFEPITINKTEFKNRMVVSAMVTNYCNEDGTPTEKFMAYHEHKAKGGYGIIITEDFAVTRTAGASKTLAGLWEDRKIEPWSAFTDRIHKAGAKNHCPDLSCRKRDIQPDYR
jgi:2,4-dienoyl-CoA reductase-like NADH-dependent reductase (Old Yellow Enzyme family)